jgi:hypothetical protein
LTTLEEAIDQAIAAKRHESITAASIANAVVRGLARQGKIGTYGSQEHIREVADAVLRAMFDPCQQMEFEGLLERYPAAQKINGETVYVRKEAMTQADTEFNVERMRRAAEAFEDSAEAFRRRRPQ